MQHQIPGARPGPGAADKAAAGTRDSERRRDLRKRAIVDISVAVEPANVLSRVEYLRSRDIEAHVIERVLQRFFDSSQPLGTPPPPAAEPSP